MKNIKELKESAEACFARKSCAGCHYVSDIEGNGCLIKMLKNALALIEQQEEQIQLMQIQMEGDCGCCKHRHDERTIDAPWLGGKLSPACNECLDNGGRKQWEYEGLPELPKKGASS